MKYPVEEYSKKIDGDDYSINIYGFYDKEWNSWRYSWSVQTVGSYMASGGYVDDNSVAYSTKESALEIKNSYRKSLEGGETVAKSLAEHSNNELWFDWTEYLDVLWWPKVDTTFDQKKLKKLG